MSCLLIFTVLTFLEVVCPILASAVFLWIVSYMTRSEQKITGKLDFLSGVWPCDPFQSAIRGWQLQTSVSLRKSKIGVLNPKTFLYWADQSTFSRIGCIKGTDIFAQTRLLSSFEAPWSERSWILNLCSIETQNLLSDLHFLKEPHLI